jgi:SAM-dependent methyltransferase
MPYDASMAAAYGRGRRLRPDDINRWMAAALPFLPAAGGHVLDLGAGTGRFSAALARACGAIVVACEPSAEMRARWTGVDPRVHLVAGTAEALPLHNNVFDAVWASQVIHHVGDLPAFASNLRRVLKPAGHLLLRGGFGPAEQLPLFPYFPQAWAPGSSLAISLSHIGDVLASSGIKLVEHLKIAQLMAGTTAELLDKVRSRSLSNLAALPDSAFERGCRELERAALAGDIPIPVVEHLDLVAFRSSPA